MTLPLPAVAVENVAAEATEWAESIAVTANAQAAYRMVSPFTLKPCGS
jgi:hypothetical protein